MFYSLYYYYVRIPQVCCCLSSLGTYCTTNSGILILKPIIFGNKKMNFNIIITEALVATSQPVFALLDHGGEK